ncbi:hypothetical protein [Streptomyces sp. NPDC001401]|uniref:hypothetical protein n=1 Tax=Streptomyces sp. NPDC001401 TaxID=3364570 RepID=UPI0036B763F6
MIVVLTPCWDLDVFRAEVPDEPECLDVPEVFDVPCDSAVLDADAFGELPVLVEPFWQAVISKPAVIAAVTRVALRTWRFIGRFPSEARTAFEAFDTFDALDDYEGPPVPRVTPVLASRHLCHTPMTEQHLGCERPLR